VTFGLQVTLHAVPELLTDIVYPATLEACAQLMDDIKEMREQIRKQLQRIEELRVKKTTEPGMWFETVYALSDHGFMERCILRGRGLERA
jgi:hypothetical protein